MAETAEEFERRFRETWSKRQGNARGVLYAARAMQAAKYRRTPNWSFVGMLFSLGSGFAWEACREMGIDPDAYTIEAHPASAILTAEAAKT